MYFKPLIYDNIKANVIDRILKCAKDKTTVHHYHHEFYKFATSVNPGIKIIWEKKSVFGSLTHGFNSILTSPISLFLKSEDKIVDPNCFTLF